MNHRLLKLLAAFLMAIPLAKAQDTIMPEKKKILPELKNIEIVQMIQLWDVHTFENSGSTGNEKRNDIYIRRGRIGVRGKLKKSLSFNVVFAYDGIGRNKQTAGNGNLNEDDNREFYLWDAFWTWSYKPMLNVTAGFFRPQVGREHITAAFTVLSFEKALTNFQTRTHFVGRNTGRETGINIGGLYLANNWSFNYNIGAFDMTHEKIVGGNTRWYPMLVSRAAFTIGDPEMEDYKLGYTNSYYGSRKGVTLAVNGTYQGETEIFKANSFYGADILANYGPFDFVAEYDWMYRNSFTDTLEHTKTTVDQVYSVRLGYNIKLKSEKIIQLAIMYSDLISDQYGKKENANSLTGAPDQNVFDIGINYLLNKEKLKFNLHYVSGKRFDRPKDKNYSYLGTGFQYLF